MSKWYDMRNLKGDLTGGMTAGIVALPLALAFGVQSGLGAIAGLYGAMMVGFFAAFLGGTATQVSGPTGPMTVVSASVIATAIELTGSLERGMGIIIGSFMLAGGFQILFGLLQFGKYIKYIPYPVLSGFMSGIGAIIVIHQVFPLIGISSQSSTVEIVNIIGVVGTQINWQALGLGIITMAIIYTFPMISKAVPSTLVALFISSLAAHLLDLNVPVIGDIPAGLPSLLIGEIFAMETSYIWLIFQFAATLAALGMIDSLLTSVIADNITKTKHDSNRELIGQGIGNILASFIGGLPGAGATMRTIVNIKSGGKTRLSGMFHGLILLLILVGASDYAAFIPLTVLSGILITVGIGIVDRKGMLHLFHVPRSDAVVLLIVLVLTVFGNLIQAVGVGMVLACVLFMKQSSDTVEAGASIKPLDDIEDAEDWRRETVRVGDILINQGLITEIQLNDVLRKQFETVRIGDIMISQGLITQEQLTDALKKQKIEQKNSVNRVYIKHLDGPIFFGFASRFQEMITELDDELEILIIEMSKVPYVDQSGLYVLEDSILLLQNNNVLILMTGLQSQPLDMLKKIGLIPDLVPDSHVFNKFDQCKTWIDQNIDFNNK